MFKQIEKISKNSEIDNGSAIFEGDALELLTQVDRESVDLILTDPPYNVSRKNNFKTMGRAGIEYEWDGDFDQTLWLIPAVEALRPGGSMVIFNSWQNLGTIDRALKDLGMVVKDQLVWLKTNPMPRNIDRRFVPALENAIWAVKPRAKWTFNFEAKKTSSESPPESARAASRSKKCTNTCECDQCKKARKLMKPRAYHNAVFMHACQNDLNKTKKPVKMFKELIELFSNPGELVLDPFLGNGTTLIAAAQTGRKAVGFELNHVFYQHALNQWQEAHSARARCA